MNRASVMRDYVEAMGGELRLVAEFPDRPPVILKGLAGMDAGLLPKGVTGIKDQHRERNVEKIVTRRSGRAERSPLRRLLVQG